MLFVNIQGAEYAETAIQGVLLCALCDSTVNPGARFVKGRNPMAMQLATAGLWLLGEFIGGFLGMLLWPPTHAGLDPTVYIAAIIGAVTGGIAAVKIAESRPAMIDTTAENEQLPLA